MGRAINTAGLELIKRFEGFRGEAYLCPGDVWTIGYGHTEGVREGDTCTTAEAEQWLRADLRVAERAVAESVRVPLTDNQFAVLVSFAFNCGAGNLRRSTLLQELNKGHYFAVATELPKWNMAGGQVQAGLVRRRAAEVELWNTFDGATVADTNPLMRYAPGQINPTVLAFQKWANMMGYPVGAEDGKAGPRTSDVWALLGGHYLLGDPRGNL